MTNPFDQPELYSAYTLAGTRSPGVVTLKGLKRPDKWDIKEGGGQDGDSTSRKGRKLIAFKAIHSIVIDPGDGVNQFDDWDAFLPLLKSTTAGKDSAALDFYHPDAARLDMKSVVVTEIGGLDHDGMGGAKVSVSFLEYSPPKPKPVGGPSGSKSAGSGTSGASGANADPNAKRKQELGALLNQAKQPL